MKKLGLTQVFIYTSLISFVLLAVLTALIGNSIDVGGDPNVVVVDYLFYSRKLWQVNIGQYFVLTVLAALIHYRRAQRFFYFPGMLLFVLFANYHYIYQSDAFFRYKNDLGIGEGSFEVGFLIGILQSITIVIATGLMGFSIHLLRKRLQARV